MSNPTGLSKLWQALQQSFSTVPLKQRRQALSDLRGAFLAGEPPGDYLADAATRAAYEEFFFPQSLTKAASVFAELEHASIASVLDLGAAMGPFAFAAATVWPGAQLTLLDQSEAALQAAVRLGKSIGVTLEAMVGSFTRALPARRYDLIVLGNALLEASDDQADALLHRLFEDHLSDRGWLVIVEPADRPHARRLQALRDRQRAHQRFAVRPCPHDQPCPAQVRERDFCHEARELELPPFFTEAAAVVGLSDHRMRFSYLIYRATNAPARNDDVVRIISHPLKEKGRLRYFGCSAGGMVEVMRQDRLRSPTNAAFDHLGRGALIRVKGAAPRIKLGDTDPVIVVRDLDEKIDD